MVMNLQSLTKSAGDSNMIRKVNHLAGLYRTATKATVGRTLKRKYILQILFSTTLSGRKVLEIRACL